MKPRCLIALVCLALAVAGRAADAAAKPAFDANRFLELFYQSPQPDRLSDFLAAVSIQGWAEGKNSRPPLLGFLAEIITAYPDRTEGWRGHIPPSDTALRRLWDEAAVLSHKGGVRTVIDHSPAINDMNWGAFAATGHADFVNRLIAEVPHHDERDDLNLFVTGNTACWSLGSKARSEPKVRQLLENAQASAPPRTRTLIGEILTRDPASYRQEMIEVIREQRRKGKWL